MKKISKGWKILIGIVSLFWGGLFIAFLLNPEEKTADQITQESIDKNFSPWDGSHLELTKLIKSKLKDPDSYEHIKTTYLVKGDTILVFTNYRARNSFGGMMNDQITGITDKNTGQVFEIIQQK